MTKYILSVLIVLGSLFFSSQAEATWRETRLALARICVSEAGFSRISREHHRLTNRDDCAAIHEVLQNRRRPGQSLMGIMRQYSSLTFNTDRQDRRRWLAHLNVQGTEPEGWPAHWNWDRTRRAWLRTIRLAGRVMAGRELSTCDRRADHWGAQWYTRRALRAGWEVIDCGDTHNKFWTIP